MGGVQDGGDPGAAQDENVDQYFDDGGETFLPADHVSYPLSLQHLKHLRHFLSQIKMLVFLLSYWVIQIVTAMLLYSYSR